MDIILISEAKLDNCFPINEFLIEGFPNQIKFDRTYHGGGVLLYIREDIPFKGYLRYKTITSQNVSSEAQIKNFFIS